MKIIRARVDGAVRFPEGPMLGGVNVVSVLTRRFEDATGASPRLRNRLVSWRKLVRNRIAFRHDERRGPISATLTGAVY